MEFIIENVPVFVASTLRTKPSTLFVGIDSFTTIRVAAIGAPTSKNEFATVYAPSLNADPTISISVFVG